jgi:hypothetical protein
VREVPGSSPGVPLTFFAQEAAQFFAWCPGGRGLREEVFSICDNWVQGDGPFTFIEWPRRVDELLTVIVESAGAVGFAATVSVGFAREPLALLEYSLVPSGSYGETRTSSFQWPHLRKS